MGDNQWWENIPFVYLFLFFGVLILIIAKKVSKFIKRLI